MLRVLKRNESFERPKQMFILMGKKIITILRSKRFLIWIIENMDTVFTKCEWLNLIKNRRTLHPFIR